MLIELDYWNIIFNIINVIVLYLLMKRFLFKPVTEMMEKRKNAIETSLADAENNNKEAKKLKQEYKEVLETADVQALDIIKEAQQRAIEEHERQMKATKEEAAKLLEEAIKSIELERKLSLQNIKAEVAGIAMLAATKVIQKNMDDNSNNKIINDFLVEAGAVK